MNKLMLSTLGGIAAAVIAASAFTAAAEAQTTTVRIGSSAPADLENDNGMSAWIIRNYVNERSDTLNVELHFASALGSDQDVLQALQLGSGATMFIGGTALLNTFIPATGVLDLPFLWTSFDHVGRALDGEVGDTLEQAFEGAGFKVLGWSYSWGYRNVVTRQPVAGADQIQGLKIRTIQSPIYVAALNAMGANATPMAFGEIYTALQTGVLDGFEHAASMVYSSKLYEVTDHVALTRHLFGPTVILYSLPLWNQLDEQEQQVMQEAVDLAVEINRALTPGREREALARLEEVGMTVTEVDTAGFQERAVPLQDELAAGIGATELLEQIRQAR